MCCNICFFNFYTVLIFNCSNILKVKLALVTFIQPYEIIRSWVKSLKVTTLRSLNVCHLLQIIKSPFSAMTIIFLYWNKSIISKVTPKTLANNFILFQKYISKNDKLERIETKNFRTFFFSLLANQENCSSNDLGCGWKYRRRITFGS